MTIACLSDLHGHLPDTPPCDLLILAGDLCPNGDPIGQCAWLNGTFRRWLTSRRARWIVATWGNHDFVGEHPDLVPRDLPWTLLVDAYATVGGVRIYASPWTPQIGGWAFMRPRPAMQRIWERWTKPVDILITHGPAYGTCDQYYPGGVEHLGCEFLADRLAIMRPRLHVCGHIHEAHGRADVDGLTTINAAHVDRMYEPAHPATIVDGTELFGLLAQR